MGKDRLRKKAATPALRTRPTCRRYCRHVLMADAAAFFVRLFLVNDAIDTSLKPCHTDPYLKCLPNRIIKKKSIHLFF